MTSSSGTGRQAAYDETAAVRRPWYLLFGPAVLTGAFQFGPGNLTTSITSGATNGYQQLWVIALSTFFLAVFVDMGSRIALGYEETPIGVMKKRWGATVGAVVGIGVVVMATTFQVANITSTGVAMSLLVGGPSGVWSGVLAVLIIGLLWRRGVYTKLERVVVAMMVLMVVAIVATAILARPDASAAARGLAPSFSGEQGVLLVGLIGTNLSMTAAFFNSYFAKEKRAPRHEYRRIALFDTIPGTVVPGVMTMLVIVTAAAVLHGTGKQVDSPAGLTRLLEPSVGAAASVVFALGFAGAAFSSMITNATASGSVLSDALGRGAHFDDRMVKLSISGLLVVCTFVSVVFQAWPVQLILVTQALTVVLAPAIAVVLVVLSSNRAVLRGLSNNWWKLTLGMLGVAAVLATDVKLISGLLG